MAEEYLEIIKARVWWKVDSEAEWIANPLILGPGEPAWVVNENGQGVNVKIGDGTKKFSELPYFVDYAGGQFIAVESNVLPEPEAPVAYSFVPEGTYSFAGQPDLVVSAGHWGQVNWDGSSWSLVDMGELPVEPKTTDVNEGNPLAPTSDATWKADKAIDNKVLTIVKEDETEIIHKDVSDTATGFGASVNAYGWGFPAVARTNIKQINIRLGASVLSTSQSITVRENSKTGTILKFKAFSKNISGSSVLVEFDFSDSPIVNPNNANLWIEIRANSTLTIYRLTPAVVFSSANGYPVVSYSTTNDVNGSTLPTNSANMDFYHEVITVEEGITDLTDWMKGKINESVDITVTDAVEAGNFNPVESDAVAIEVERIDSTIGQIASYDSEIIGEQTFKDVAQTSSVLGTSTITGWGFPLKERQNILNIPIKIANTVASTQQVLSIRENDRDGAVLVTKAYNRNIPTSGPGVLVDFELDGILENPNNTKLWAEIYSATPFGIFRVTPAQVFTEADGYPFVRTTTATDMGVTRVFTGGPSSYYDIYHEVVVAVVDEGYKFTENMREQISTIASETVVQSESGELPNENERISFTGSSVTWGDGYLQSGYVGEYIKWKQSKLAQAILATELEGGILVANRQYFLGQARKITGVGQEFEFKIKGNEVSIIQGIERSNANASEIELYIDGNLHDTFNNFNPTPIGAFTKNFTGDGTIVMFDLGNAFTYGHTVTVGGASNIVTLNTTQNTGFTIPTGSDCAIIRRLGVDENGNSAVTHWLWFKVAPTNGQAIIVNGTRGKALFYEETTIGQDVSGNNESPYGDGDTSFDPLAPSSVATGLDFRQTDDRVVNTYRFLDNKERTVRLRIKGNYGAASGTPYFIFNFATNRYFHFQNAGIGGWDLWDLDKTISQDALRGWQRVIEFNPDKLVVETTPNDDWIVKGHKVYSSATLSLAELRATKNLPLRSIDYNSGNDDYTMTRWRGFITAITEDSVTFSGTVDTPIVVGDVVMIGQYWGNNKDYIERIVAGVSGSTISFNKPITKGEIIYSSLQDFVGKEIGVRSLGTFKTKLEGLIDKIRSVTDKPIYLLENPMPNVLGRELWGYPIVMDMVANSKVNVHSVDYSSLRRWQESQAKETTTLNVTSAVLDHYLNKRVLEFGTNGQNLLAVDVLLNGASIYGKRAVVQNGWAYTVNQSATGLTLNKLASGTTNSGQVYNGRAPRLVILDDALTSGIITVKWAGSLWSNDSCHMNANGSKLYADFLRDI